MSAYLSPIGNEPQIDASGDPLVGGKIYTYLAGSSTPQVSFTNSAGTVQQANPIILNARGAPDSPIWLQGGAAYKMVITDENDVTLQTIDGITGVNDPSSSETSDEWVLYLGEPTYISATSFSVGGDQTNIFQQNRRIRSSNTGGTIYSSIIGSAFAGDITTVTVRNDSGTLDAGLSQVSYGFLSADDSSVPADYMTVVPGYLYGLGLTNNSGDATNDIDFATGACADSTNTLMMIARTAMTKQLDAAWAAGTNAGGRMSAAAIANTTYHCFAIRKDSDGSVDFGFDTSPTAPTMPSGYTYFRRIGSVLRAGGALVPFVQRGDEFSIKTPALDISVANPGTSAVTRTLASLPTGIEVLAKMIVDVGGQVASTNGAYISALTDSDIAASSSHAQVFFATVSGGTMSGLAEAWTNTSAQVRSRIAASDGSTNLRIRPLGWVDLRGRA
jgi:hypothetical protein